MRNIWTNPEAVIFDMDGTLLKPKQLPHEALPLALISMDTAKASGMAAISYISTAVEPALQHISLRKVGANLMFSNLGDIPLVKT